MKSTLVTSLIILMISGLFSPAIGQEDFLFQTRLDYYTNEQEAEVLFKFPKAFPELKVQLTVGLDSKTISRIDTITFRDLYRMTIPLTGMEVGKHELVAWIDWGGKSAEVKADLNIYHPKGNAVKIDRLIGSVLINDLPWFPFGFYCYSPVQPTLAEEEVVKGFNLMSPYQQVDPETIESRQTYMDRCAQLGMKVNYQLISVAGGGGVGSAAMPGSSKAYRMALLKAEIEHFKDHQALLSWYIADEPVGQGADPESLKIIYDSIKKWDPYHPVTIVFMAPREARRFADAMDIVMADPYPIPRGSVVEVGQVAENLKKEFRYEKPVWIVPQAFGGNEWWSREPSPNEIRVMTYLALNRGATGIQYFVRHGLNGFPKSQVTWAECAKISMEVAEITPFLLKGIQVDEMMVESAGLWMNAWELNGQLMVMVVNTKNTPRAISLTIPERFMVINMEEVFDHRALTAENSELSDWIGPMGVQIYRTSEIIPSGGDENLIDDPDFEDTYSYGVPARCYNRVGSDRGATAFLDTREVYHGKHSMRITTPVAEKGMGFSFFPVLLNSGQSYRFTIYAKPDTTSWMKVRKTFWQRLFRKKIETKRQFKIKIGNYSDTLFDLKPGWQPYTFYVTIPDAGDESVKVSPYLELIGQGVAWFDQMSLIADPVIGYRVDEVNKQYEIQMRSVDNQQIIHYNLAGREPELSDPVYHSPFPISKTTTVSAGVFENQTLQAWTWKSFMVHLAIGRKPVYNNPYTSRYAAGGPLGLTDGMNGSRNYLDGHWQGFNGQDMIATIDLDSVRTINQVTLGCLQNTGSWIFMPLRVRVEGSVDGNNYQTFREQATKTDEHRSGAIREEFVLPINNARIRFLKVTAENRKVCPDWHRGRGKGAFIFIDEIRVE